MDDHIVSGASIPIKCVRISRSMNKRKTMPKFAKEIIITAVSYAVLCLLSYFFVGEFVSVSDSGLSTIGLALSAAVGGLTAITVSFVLIVWQFSNRDRNENFRQWRETLDHLDKLFVDNIGLLRGMLPELSRLLLAASRVSLINPMPIEKITEIFNGVEEKLQEEKFKQLEICKRISNLLTPLLTYGIGHTSSNRMYLRILNLRGLLYRLITVLMAGITVVALANTSTSLGISDAFNFPLAVTLIGWFIYVLISLAREIKDISWLEDELKKRRGDMLKEWQSM